MRDADLFDLLDHSEYARDISLRVPWWAPPTAMHYSPHLDLDSTPPPNDLHRGDLQEVQYRVSAATRIERNRIPVGEGRWQDYYVRSLFERYYQNGEEGQELRIP